VVFELDRREPSRSRELHSESAVHPSGFEPLTFGSVDPVCRSTQPAISSVSCTCRLAATPVRLAEAGSGGCDTPVLDRIRQSVLLCHRGRLVRFC